MALIVYIFVFYPFFFLSFVFNPVVSFVTLTVQFSVNAVQESLDFRDNIVFGKDSLEDNEGILVIIFESLFSLCPRNKDASAA